jgi:hypothetical protein
VSISKGGQPAGSRRLIARVLGMPVTRLSAAAGVVALGISGLFGGLDPVDPGMPTVPLNTVDKGSPWNVTVTGVRVVGELEPLRLKDQGDHWIAVLATVEITADESRNDLNDVVRIPEVDGLLADTEQGRGRPDYVYLMRDAVNGPYLHPGLPEKLAFIWEQRASTPVPATATVEIWGKTRRADSLTGHQEWLDAGARAVVPDVPVQDKRTSK